MLVIARVADGQGGEHGGELIEPGQTLVLALADRGQHRPKVWVDSWVHDPWTGGSYAAFGPGHHARYAGFMGQPEGDIQFAGEHTVLSTMGYLDGAVSSGERAARHVLDSLG